jgi:hypothetical protein
VTNSRVAPACAAVRAAANFGVHLERQILFLLLLLFLLLHPLQVSHLGHPDQVLDEGQEQIGGQN